MKAKPSNQLLLPLLKPLLLFLLPLSILLLLFHYHPSFTTTASNPNPNLISTFGLDLNFSSSSSSSTTTESGGDLRIRRGYRSYEEYIARQLNKTLDPRLRRIWTTRDWERKVAVFAAFFRLLQAEGLLHNDSAALCVGARTGQEVAALRRVGVVASVGMDLVPAPPLVVAGDFHQQPFPDASFDFEFSNVFDHALFPAKFVGEVERTLRPGGVCVLHVALRRRGDKYSANDLYSVDAVVRLFKESDLLRIREVDGFGLDTEVVMRKWRRRGREEQLRTTWRGNRSRSR